MSELLPDLAIGLFKNVEHGGPGGLIGFALEFDGKMRTVAAGQTFFGLFCSADLRRDGPQIGLHGGIFPGALGGLIEVTCSFAQLILFL